MLVLLRPVLELAVIIPGIFLAYLPVKSYLKQPPLRLLCVLLPLFICLSFAWGMVCLHFNISTAPVMALLVFVAIMIYIHTLHITLWMSISVALAVCAVFACVNSMSRAINALFTADLTSKEAGLCFSIGAGLIYNLICWIFTISAYYPATHAARNMVEDENFAQTWYVFWILPVLFIALNIFMVPRYRSTLYTGRILKGYIVISLTLLALLVLFYSMFLMLAKNINRNAKLAQENHFFSMQQERYDNLRSSIEEARQARHDMRHYFNQLSAMAEEGDLEHIKAYLANATKRIPSLDMHFCDNRAADSVIGYYCALAKQENIPFETKIDLPETLPADEIDICIILSNLLENALEASLRTSEEKRRICLEAYVHADRLTLIHVKNSFDGELHERNDIFQSSKRKGNGVGIQSIRHIADKNNGACSFTHENGIFTAKVMIRG